MTTFAVDPGILRDQALHEFSVRNWPDHLQQASRIERQLLGLMAHPCYQLHVTIDEDGATRLVVRPSAGKESPLTDDARTFIKQHRGEIIAWVQRTDADRARLQGWRDE
jgi:hypothetical protein